MFLMFLGITLFLFSSTPALWAKSTTPSTAPDLHPVPQATYIEEGIETKPETDDIAQIENLLRASQENVAQLTRLKRQLIAYQAAQKVCIYDPDNQQKLLKMASEGKYLLDMIQEMRLTSYFRQEFISELALMAKTADKKSIPSVKLK